MMHKNSMPTPKNKQNKRTGQHSPALLWGREAIDQLGLHYDPNNTKDINWLAYILGQILKYPSAAKAEKHRKANKLGQFDHKTKEEIQQELQDKVDEQYFKDNILQSKQINQIKKVCKCCGLTVQEQYLSLNTPIQHINHVGMSTTLYFMTIQNLMVLLFILLLGFTLFASVTDFQCSILYRQNISIQRDLDLTQRSYQGILMFSLGSKHFYKGNQCQNLYLNQCWLGSLCVMFWGFIFVYIKKQQKQFQVKVDYETVSAGDYTLMFNHIPQQYSSEGRQFFQEALQKYVKTVKDVFKQKMKGKRNQNHAEGQFLKCFKESKVPIEVQKVNRVSYYNLQYYYSGEDDKQFLQIGKKLKQKKQQWIQLIKYRKTHDQFAIDQQQLQNRKTQYSALLKSFRAKKKQLQLKKVKDDETENKFNHFIAFVTFKHTFNKDFIENLHSRQNSFFSRLPFAEKRQFLKLPDDKNNYNHQTEIIVKAAPQPEDIIWSNFTFTFCERLRMQLLTFLATIILLCISFFGVYFMTQYQIKSQKQQHSWIFNKFLSLGISLIIFVINFLLAEIMKRLTKLEKNITYTKQQTSIAIKSIIAVFVNSIIIPIAVNYIIKQNLFGVDGLADDVFFQALTNAILTPLLKVFNPSYIKYLVFRWWYNRPSNRLNFNQRALNKLNEELPFLIGQEYVQIVSMYLFACFYASLQPLVVVLCLVGLFLMNYAQKFSLYRVSKRPTPGSNQINTSMYTFIFLGPLLFAFGNFCWTNIFQHQNFATFANTVSIIIAAAIFFVPYDDITQLQMKGLKDVRQSKYQHDRFFFPSQYDRLNPLTRKQATQQFHKYYQKYLFNLSRKSKQDKKEIMHRIKKQNMYGTGQQEEYDSADEEQNQNQLKQDHQAYYEIYLNNSDLELLQKQTKQLQQFLKKIKDSGIQYYLYSGEYNNQDLRIVEVNMQELNSFQKPKNVNFTQYKGHKEEWD